MKKTKIILMLSFVVFFNCKNKVDNKNLEVKDSTTSDRFEIIKKQAQTKNCKETFDSFFKSFSIDSTFQKSRIILPLKHSYFQDVTLDEPTIEYISKITNFKYIDFSKDNDAKNKEYDKFTIEKEVFENKILYKRIGLDNGIREIYVFEKQNECWFMVEILDESS
jgi:hypothetical protein